MKFVIALPILLVFAATYVAYDRTKSPSDGNYEERYAYWRGEFEDGPDDAYARLVAYGGSLSYDASHELAHMAGEIVYEQSGMDGISICAPDFEFGCYHGFAGQALSEAGLDPVTGIDAACRASSDPLGCEHGIGHGVLAFFGNGELVQALAICASLRQESPVGGCFGGVFMEYNFNTMQSNVGIAVRPFGEADADEPCASLPEEFKIPCYFDQPSWWHAAATDGLRDERDRFRDVGARCAALAPAYKDACYQGIGNVVGPTSGYDAGVIEDWCGTMPEEGRDACRSFALGHLTGEGT